jgi:hypothetical protein
MIKRIVKIILGVALLGVFVGLSISYLKNLRKCQ